MKQKVIIFGSTGSIGLSCLRVLGLAENSSKFEISGLTAGNNLRLFEQQIKTYNPQYIYISDQIKAKKLKRLFPKKKIFSGSCGLKEIAIECPADIAVFAVSGTAALEATFAALQSIKRIALANKEVMVCCGELFKNALKNSPAEVIPIDSELSAIFQCLAGQDINQLHRILLTASGGPFFKLPLLKLKEVSLDDALKHPVWKMGKKITIDSATLMNKALEIIETHFLFEVPFPKIEVLIHPQSIVHSMIELNDGSLLAQLSVPDMALPIQFALTYPRRAGTNSFPLNWEKISRLEFYKPDRRRFAALNLAYQALEVKKSAPLALHIANEVAVEAFLQSKLPFYRIVPFVKKALEKFDFYHLQSIDDVLELQDDYRHKCSELLKRGS